MKNILFLLISSWGIIAYTIVAESIDSNIFLIKDSCDSTAVKFIGTWDWVDKRLQDDKFTLLIG